MSSKKTSGWKMAVIVGGFSIAAVVMVYQLGFASREVRFAQTITLIDVGSGEVFRTSIADRGYLSPGRNPKTGARTLVPIVPDKDDPSKWHVPGNMMSVLDGVEGDLKAVDGKTGDVVVPVAQPVDFPHPSKWGEKPPLAS